MSNFIRIFKKENTLPISIWSVIFLLLIPPIWVPVGEMFGIPFWVLSTVMICLMTSVLINYIILRVWNNSEAVDKKVNPDKN